MREVQADLLPKTCLFYCVDENNKAITKNAIILQAVLFGGVQMNAKREAQTFKTRKEAETADERVYNLIYLGEGIYAMFDGFGIMLMTNSHERLVDTIYLEPQVLRALNQWVESWDENNE